MLNGIERIFYCCHIDHRSVITASLFWYATATEIISCALTKINLIFDQNLYQKFRQHEPQKKGERKTERKYLE